MLREMAFGCSQALPVSRSRAGEMEFGKWPDDEAVSCKGLT